LVHGSKEGLIDMTTTRLTLVVLLLAAASPARGQGWAEKMFKDGTSHDFGTVPRGAQLFHRFTLTNIYAVRMEVTGIASGCGCVTVTASKRVLEPRETATLDVSMDARRFTGTKAVTIRVSVGPEFTSTAELKVTANSRADVVFNPGEVGFGTIVTGQTPTQTIDVEYAGPLAWQVTEVVAKDLPFDVAAKEMYRRPGQVGYQFKVTLKADAPLGSLKEYFHFKTNDPAGPLVPVLVEATVQTAVTVSPANLALGTLKGGDAVEKKAVLRGNRSFKVLAVEGLGEGVGLKTELPTKAAAEVHTLIFRCEGLPAGTFKRELKIKTDLQEQPVVVTLEGTSEP
jgi:hypothetical protein